MGSTPSQTSYTYNKDRQLTAVTRPDGTSMPLAYDSAGRLATVTVPRGTLTYAYDATKGTLSTVSSPDGVTLAYAYDGSLLTSTTWSGAVSGSVTRTYDNDFRVTSRSVNGGDSASLSYDADGLLTGAGQLVVSRDTTTGFIDGTMLGADLVSAMSYSGFGELAGMATSYGGSSQYSTTYTRDAGGRITPLDETVVGEVRQVNYHYDAAGRLERVTEDGVDVATYTYDDNGNRLSGTDALGTVVTGSYDDQDRLTAYGSATYSYTANGDLLSKTTPAGTASYSYDALGNLTAVTLAVGTAIECRVDGQNRRVGKKVGGVLVKAWLYKDRLNPIAELDGAGAVVSRFVYGTKPHVPDYMVKGGVTYRIVSDHLGSVRLVIDAATGAVAQRLDYDAFGQVELDTAPGLQPFGFAGGLYDEQTGLVRFGARDYDAEVGRWTEEMAWSRNINAGCELVEHSNNQPYRVGRISPYCIVCGAIGEHACLRCGRPLCAKDTAPDGKRCARCEAVYSSWRNRRATFDWQAPFFISGVLLFPVAWWFGCILLEAVRFSSSSPLAVFVPLALTLFGVMVAALPITFMVWLSSRWRFMRQRYKRRPS